MTISCLQSINTEWLTRSPPKCLQDPCGCIEFVQLANPSLSAIYQKADRPTKARIVAWLLIAACRIVHRERVVQLFLHLTEILTPALPDLIPPSATIWSVLYKKHEPLNALSVATLVKLLVGKAIWHLEPLNLSPALHRELWDLLSSYLAACINPIVFQTLVQRRCSARELVTQIQPESTCTDAQLSTDLLIRPTRSRDSSPKRK